MVFGIETFLNELHREKVDFDIFVTDDGISNSIRDKHPEKHESPIFMIDDDIMIFF